MKVFAHRGSSGRSPEGTRSAYLAAIEDGADGFECDVRLTRDLEIICFHDATTKRMAGKNLIISKALLSELEEIIEVMRLEELIDLAVASKRDLLIETKHPVKFGLKIEYEVIRLLERKNLEILTSGIEIEIISFSWRSTFISQSDFSVSKISKYIVPALMSRSKKIFLDIKLLKRYQKLVMWQKRRGKLLILWTVNSKADIARSKKLGASAVISDFPDRVVKNG